MRQNVCKGIALLDKVTNLFSDFWVAYTLIFVSSTLQVFSNTMEQGFLNIVVLRPELLILTFIQTPLFNSPIL